MNRSSLIHLFSEKSPLIATQPLLEEDEQRPQSVVSLSSSPKLSTFLGVYVPTCNSIFGVIVFRRWGFAVGQAGLGSAFAMLLVGTFIALCTATSISAIATNGRSRGGGAYYYISRTLGPEFGGSIGLQFYLSQTASVGFVCLGLAETLISGFEINIVDNGGKWDTFFVATITLLVSLAIGCMGITIFAKASLYILAVIIFAIIFGVMSLWFRSPTTLDNCEGPGFLGASWDNLRENWGPSYDCTDVDGCPDNIGWLSVFAVVYISTAGFLAGSSLSGDLQKPAESIPKGTFLAIATMFTAYFLLTFSMALTFDRSCLRTNYQALQDACIESYVILFGTFCSTFSSALGCIVGAAKVLQAMASDNCLPRIEYFAKSSANGEPIRALIGTWFIAQATLFLGEINELAPYITNFILLTFMSLNLACFTLDITGMPNFRPTFQYYGWPIPLVGTIACIVCMFAVDSTHALISIFAAIAIFVAINYLKPQNSWGDIGQALIYHQVRKYLLKLDIRKEHIKFWRPQVLLFLSSTEGDAEQMTSICNDIKKGGLFVVGHILRGDLFSVANNLTGFHRDWLSKIDTWKAKCFVQISVAHRLDVGVQNMSLMTGLGSMRPNTIAFGLYGRKLRPNHFDANTDTDFADYVNCLRAVHALNKNLILLSGFSQFDRKRIEMHIPTKIKPRFDLKKHGPRAGMTIDVWFLETGSSYLSEVQVTVALQLVHILHSNEFWVKNTRVRVLYLTQQDHLDRNEYYEDLLDMTRTFADLVPVPIFEPKKYTTAYVQAGVSPTAIANLTEKDLQAYFLSLSLTQRHSIMNHIIRQHTDHSALVYLALSIDRDVFSTRSHSVSEKERSFFHRLRVLTQDLPPTLVVFPSQQPVTTNEL